MLTGILSFLGGSVFRMIWGEVSHFVTTWQDHKQEMERLELQGRLDGEAHSRQQEAIRLQAELGIQTIRVQGEMDVAKSQALIAQTEADGWLEAVKLTGRQVGVWFVDAWNAVIRPAVATWSVAMVTLHYTQVITLDDNGWSLCGAALGIYLADRTLFKRGK